MRLAQIGEAERLSRKLRDAKDRRETWSKVDLTDSITARHMNERVGLSVVSSRLPTVDDDVEMHVALVNAIIAEYDWRIARIIKELQGMGVEL